MNLRTQNEQLRRVDMRIDSLVEDIRTELLARDNDTVKLTDTSIKQLLKYIANPLKNMSIDGNEMMLDDMLDLYDKVIAELDSIIDNKKYSDEKKLSTSELETFKKAKDILKTDKEQGIDVIDEIYTEVIKDQRSGKLEDTYIKREINKNKEIIDLNEKIYKLGSEVSKTLKPSLDLLEAITPEIDTFVELERAETIIGKIDSKLAKAVNNLADPTLSEEEKAVYEKAKESLLIQKVQEMVEAAPEFSEEAYDQEENESVEDYAERLHRAFNVKRAEAEDKFNTKVIGVLDKKINIAEYDKDKEEYKISEVEVKERYFSDIKNKKNQTLSTERLKKFAKALKEDVEELQEAVDSKINEKSELESQKEELESAIIDEIKSSTLTVVPYVEKNNGKDLSGFEKFRQRLVFRLKNPEVLWKKREEVESAMCKAKIANGTMPIDRQALLKDVESKQKEFKDKYRVRSKVKSKIYRDWDKNRIPNSRDNNTGR